MGQIQKYLGTPAVLIYILVVLLTPMVGYKYISRWFISLVTKKLALWLIALTFIGLIIVFTETYPAVDTHVAGAGSDRDDDLNIATTALLQARYPYYLKTYLNNPITHLPGSILLAVPFVLLGNSAYQNFFWLFIFFVTAKLYLKDIRLALLLFLGILILSPAVLQELMTGGDLISNSIYVLFFMLVMVRSVLESATSGWKRLASAVLLGIGLSSRANFVLIMPLVFSMLLQNAGWRPAIKYITITVLAFLVVTIPFYLYDPPGFSPLLHSFNKIDQFKSTLPYAGLAIIAASILIALALSFQRMDKNGLVLLRNCAVLQLFPVLCVVLLSSVGVGGLDFNYAGYGLNFLFFGSLAFGAGLAQRLPG